MTKASFKWLGVLNYVYIHICVVRGGHTNSFQQFGGHPGFVIRGPVETPVPELCEKRGKLWEYNGHFYNIVFPRHQWLTARNICRRQCMDAVSIETEEESNMIANVITQVGIYYPDFQSVWTSGRRCDFEECKDRNGNYQSHLLPLNVNGWFWSGTKQSIPATNKRQTSWSLNPWSQAGFYGPQPDNGEYINFYRYQEKAESCLAILSSRLGNGDGVRWHDIACYHDHPVICEDDEALIYYVQFHNPHLNITQKTRKNY